MSHLFISYASVDRGRTLEIAEAIRTLGLDVWIDQSGIAGGTNYGTEIANALRDADAVVLIASDASLASKNVRQEIMLAWRYDRPIIPLILHPLVFPDDVAYWLEGAQWIEVFDREPKAWLPKLWQALARHGIVQRDEETPLSPDSISLPETKGNLPAHLPAILGREQAIEEVLTLLGVTRAVTLTGTGGTGKTRLALEVGRRIAPSLAGGAWFVDLASITGAALVLPELAEVLSVVDTPDRPLIQGIAEAISTDPTLVIFDNLEQIPDVGQVLTDLQQRVPSLLVIATTRAALSMPGAFVYPVPQLMLPDLSRLPPPPELLQNPAVQLFVDRARQAKPDFQLNDGNARPVAEICHRLDGLPLAIEIAAARTRLLPPAAMLSRLGSRLSLLTRGSAASARQQALRDTIAWSYDLLDSDERRVFRSFGVFAGGSTIEAAERVLGSDTVDMEVIGHLEDLIDQNLLRLDSTSDSEPRIRMLETIHEYALEQLRFSGDEPGVRAAHAAYFCELVVRNKPDYNDSMDRATQQTIRSDMPNARDALDWIHVSGDGQQEIDFVNALFAYWRVAGPFSEAKSAIERSLVQAPRAATLERGDAMSALGWLAGAEGDFGSATSYFQAALALYQEAGRADREAGAHLQLATAAEYTSDYETARIHQLKRLMFHQSTGNEQGVARVEQDLSRIAYFQGDYAGSLELGLRSLATFRRVSDVPNIAITLIDVTSTEMLSGMAAESVEHIGEAIRLLQSLDDQYVLSVAIVTQGRALQLAGDLDGAQAALEEGIARADEFGDRNLRSIALYGLGSIAAERGRTELARTHLDEALVLVCERGDQWLETEVWDLLGRVELEDGDYEVGARSLGRAEAIRKELGTQISPVNRARHAETVAGLRAALGAEAYDEAFAFGKASRARPI